MAQKWGQFISLARCCVMQVINMCLGRHYCGRRRSFAYEVSSAIRRSPFCVQWLILPLLSVLTVVTGENQPIR